MMTKLLFSFGMCLIGLECYCQDIAIKSNILYDVTSTVNLGFEVALSDQLTLDISGNYNPWSFSQGEKVSGGVTIPKHDAKIKHWLVQPELRWWTCEKFFGHFLGLHGYGGQFNVGGLSFLPDGWGDGFSDNNGLHQHDGIQYKRFQGWLAGAGISYGYHWILTDRFSLEFTVGMGYAYLKYDKYGIQSCDPKEASKYLHYFGPTKLGLTAVFMLK